MMTEKETKQRQAAKPAYRQFVNPKQFNQFLDGRGVLHNRHQIAEQFGYNWHARKLKFEPHFRGHVLLQATAYESTRDHQWAAAHDPLFATCDAAVQISVSGLAQANRNRPLEPYVVCMQQVMDAVARLPHRKLRALDKETWQGITHLLNRTDLFDATTLTLPPKLAEWAEGVAGTKADAAELKLQVKLAGQSGAMKHLMVTPAPGSDAPYFEDLLGDLAAQEGVIFLFDGGYWNLKTYQQIVDSHNHFVTKRAGNIKPHLVKELALPQEPLSSGYTVLQDALVYLGDNRTQLYRMLKVRLTNGEQITLITSLLTASADQICLLYRYRWTIEIVFRWLRQTLQLDDHLTSHHPRGILRQILTALIVWGLLIIANQDADRFSPKQMWRQLQADLHQAILEFGYRLGLKGADLAFE
jgi:hypothetical protein